VDFEWDDAKAAANEAKHGISFDDAISAFRDPQVVLVDATRDADGETRMKVIGRIEGKLFVVVFTERGQVRRIISARRANGKEERIYGDRESEA
jgi:hypothetical protein